MAQFNTRELRAWAVKGAEQRLAEIAAETGAIYEAFPELRGRSQSRSLPRDTPPVRQTPNVRGRKRGGRRRMSEEGRSRIAEAARKRWAEWRSKQGESAAPATDAAAAPAQTARAPKKR